MPSSDPVAGPRRPPLPAGNAALRWGLAALWILDAALQLQPSMFTRSVAGDVIYNAALMYQPGWLERFLYSAASLEASHLHLLLLAIAAIQLSLGVGLLIPATVRPALVGSMAWALVVWVFGQGLGFMATGTAMIEFGAPGSAILYLTLAALLWPSTAPSVGAGAIGHDQTRWRSAWSAFWVLGALLHIPFRYPPGAVLAYNFQTAAQLQPPVLAHLDYQWARFAYAHGLGLSLALAVWELGLATAVWIPRLRRPAIIVGVISTIGFWVFGQALGGVLSGLSTDPNSAPVVLLMAFALRGPLSSSQDQRPRRAEHPALAAK